MLNTMVSFIILLIACIARISCVDRHTHKTTTVTLAAHVHRGLTTVILQQGVQAQDGYLVLRQRRKEAHHHPKFRDRLEVP